MSAEEDTTTEPVAAYVEAAWLALEQLAIPDAVENTTRARTSHASDPLISWEIDAQKCVLMKLRGEDAIANPELMRLVDGSDAVPWRDRWRLLELFAGASDRIGDPGTQLAADIALADASIPMSEKGRALTPKVVSLFQLGRYDEAERLIEQARFVSSLETESGFAVACISEFARSRSDPEGAQRGLELLLEDRRATGFGRSGLVYFLLGEVARREGNGSEQFRWLQTAIHSDQSQTWWVFERTIQAGYESGRLGDVFAACAAAKIRAKDLSIPMPIPFIAAQVQGLVWTGETATAFEILRNTPAVASPDMAHIDCALGFFREAEGDLAAAVTAYKRGSTRADRSSLGNSLAGAGLVRCLALMGEAASAKEMRTRLEGTPFRQHQAEADLYVAFTEKETEAVLFERYNTLVSSHPRVLWRALALLHLGELLRNREMLMEALDLFEGAGAEPFVRRVRQVIHASGFRASKKRSSKPTLTRRQAEVVRLVGEGKSNREIADELFITPRTVAANISAVLEKYDLSSRIDIAIRVAAGEFP